MRTESNTDILKEKYAQFNKTVSQDLPAIFLYSPIYIFPTDSAIKGIDIKNIHLPSERFSQINKWYIKTKRIWR
jgi:peptide/nickel transport system substrate-binding protein